ncbi:hypothetical protein [Amycolatopsis sp. PS_44_ISF1]|uniref:hypothetical protein n=1 Tax=Amycolatopsis sp. PS_44_ISF1 TaxID=2974917 RepID=UPI0028DF7194|nr:hypothetical protein [Amycolatopsis sp. PS_44_ISF1]MDT8913147.1 hypothetical protein [Amycolatopsis sp. PS_44_ISF1]
MAASSDELRSQVVAFLVGKMKAGAPADRKAGPGGLAWLRDKSPAMGKILAQCRTEAGVRQFVLEGLGPDLDELRREVDQLRNRFPAEREPGEGTGK